MQLADQLKYLIGTGECSPGTRLPATLHLAANLQINRNTVLSADTLLADEGYVSGRRGGGTVVAGARATIAAETHFDPDLLSIVDQLVERAVSIGLTPEEMAALVASHARIKESVAKLRVCFVECNPHSLDHYVGQIRREFDVTVLPVLLRDLGAAAERDELAKADCIVSTSVHLSEVRRILRPAASKPNYWRLPFDRTSACSSSWSACLAVRPTVSRTWATTSSRWSACSG